MKIKIKKNFFFFSVENQLTDIEVIRIERFLWGAGVLVEK